MLWRKLKQGPGEECSGLIRTDRKGLTERVASEQRAEGEDIKSCRRNPIVKGSQEFPRDSKRAGHRPGRGLGKPWRWLEEDYFLVCV